MRCHDYTRRFWTMLALALRIAQALSLHEPNPPFPVSSFEREMRHRLWHMIGCLDVQASLSRASEPMIQSSWLNFQPFLNRDNEELSTILEMQVFPRTRISGPSLSHIFALAQEVEMQSTSPTPFAPRRKTAQPPKQNPIAPIEKYSYSERRDLAQAKISGSLIAFALRLRNPGMSSSLHLLSSSTTSRGSTSPPKLDRSFKSVLVQLL